MRPSAFPRRPAGRVDRLVLAGHLSGTAGFGELDLGIGDYAHFGVMVFFVISGFLITSLL